MGFFEDAEHCESIFFPCSDHAIGNLLLMAIYGFILSKGSGWIADGAERLIDVLPGPLVGGLILPVLGAVPDAAMIVVSTMGGSAEEIKEQVTVGVGTLAGSTIMLLTLPLFGTMWLARCDLDHKGEAIDKQCSKFTCKSMTKTGVTVTKDVPLTSLILLGSAICYLIIQVPAFIYANSPGIAGDEHYFALAASIVCFLVLAGYSVFMIFFPKYPKRILNAIRGKRHVLNVLERLSRPLLFQREVIRSGPRPVVSAETAPLLGSTNQDGTDRVGSLLPTPRMPIAPERLRHLGREWKAKAHAQKTRRDYGVAEEGRAQEADDDDDDEKPQGPLTTKQKVAIWAKALLWLGLGTATVAVFSDPMVDSISTLSHIIDSSGHVGFYISFIITPVASNASELISSLCFAKKKQRKVTSVSFSALLGAATMNNTLCLGIFLFMIFLKNIVWDFSAEVFAIIFVEVVVTVLCLWRTHRLWKGIVFLLMYPAALGLVFFLENVLHWH
eukprot:GAFH01001314.1.p1 GENE.GAFH01001314.1~~GAFH01001314.1.p1  ORF type:complete len:500 (+),score=179.78 GAFH01001314.1:31-1530(+)